MPTKLYRIQWLIDDKQPRAVHRAALAQSKALEAQHLRTLKAMEAGSRSAAHATGGAVTAQANGQIQALNVVASAAKKASQDRINIAEREARAVEQIAARQAARVAAITAKTRAAAAALPETAPGEVSTAHFFRGRSSKPQDAALKARYAAASAAAKAEGIPYKDYVARHTTLERVRIADVLAGQDTVEKEGLHRYADPAMLRAKHLAGDLPAVDLIGKARIAADGHHRLAAMSAAGQKYADVMVTRLPPVGGAGAAGAGAADKGAKIDVGYYKVVADQIKAAQKKESEIDSIESKYVAKDYQRRVKAEAQKERLDDFARSRTAKAISDRESLESAWLARDYKERVKHEIRKENSALGPNGRLAKVKRQALTQEQMDAAALNRAHDAYHARRINQISQEKYGYQSTFKEAIAGAVGLDQAVTNAGAAVLALSVGRTIIGGITGAFADAKKNADAMAEKTLATVAGLRALAAVAGKKPTEQFGSEVLGFGVRTGLGAEKAARFQESFLGRAQIVRGKTISEPEFEKFKGMAGQVTAAKGIPEDLAGDLFGGVLKVENFRDKAQGANEAIARAMTAIKVLDAGSGKMAALAPELNKALAELTAEDKLTGVFRNAGEAAAAISTAAEFNPQEAGTLVSRTAIGLRDFEDKDKKEFMKRAAITDRDSFLEAIAKANKVIGEEVAKGVPVDTAIKKFGFTEVREMRGLKTFFGAKDTVLAPQLATLAAGEGPPGMAEAQAQIKALTAEKTFRDSQAQALKEKAQYEVGRKSTDLDIAKNRAEAQLTQFAGFKDTVFGRAGTMDQWLAGAASGFTRPGSNVLVEERALNLLKEQAGERGPMAEFQSRMTAQYGDPAAEAKRLATVIEANNKLVAENNALMKANGQGPGRQAPPAMPLIGPANGPRR